MKEHICRGDITHNAERGVPISSAPAMETTLGQETEGPPAGQAEVQAAIPSRLGANLPGDPGAAAFAKRDLGLYSSPNASLYNTCVTFHKNLCLKKSRKVTSKWKEILAHTI